jgi:hypothetical protein
MCRTVDMNCVRLVNRNKQFTLIFGVSQSNATFIKLPRDLVAKHFLESFTQVKAINCTNPHYYFFFCYSLITNRLQNYLKTENFLTRMLSVVATIFSGRASNTGKQLHGLFASFELCRSNSLKRRVQTVSIEETV